MNGKRILLVEDSKIQLAALQMVLKKEGFDILTAQNGLEGVSSAIMEKPDIIISDILMPELNGYQLCRLLKNDKQTSHIPIILLTGLDQKQDEFWGMRAGADRYILKSPDFSDLKEAVRQLIEEEFQDADSIEKSQSTGGKSVDSRSIKSSINQLLDKLLFESTLSGEARKLANFVSDREALLKEAADLIHSLVDYSCFCLCLLSPKQTRLFYDLKHPLPEEEINKIKDSLSSIFFDSIGKEKEVKTVFIKDSIKPDNSSKNKIVSKLTLLLKAHNECIGSISFYSERQNAFSPESENILNLLADDFSMVFKLLLLYDETMELSITDGLTSLYNKRYFLDYFEREFVKAKRYNHKLSLILTDIDHFKSVNDTYGHLQGDSILKEVGLILKHIVRKADFPARYGGEEFVIVAPNTDLNGTGILAEKIRETVESHNFKGKKKPMKVTTSVGVASMNGKTADKLGLIKLADEALYEAKDTGRNRVCLAE